MKQNRTFFTRGEKTLPVVVTGPTAWRSSRFASRLFSGLRSGSKLSSLKLPSPSSEPWNSSPTVGKRVAVARLSRSEGHTSELQSLMRNLVCRLLPENKKNQTQVADVGSQSKRSEQKRTRMKLRH